MESRASSVKASSLSLTIKHPNTIRGDDITADHAVISLRRSVLQTGLAFNGVANVLLIAAVNTELVSDVTRSVLNMHRRRASTSE